MRGNLLHIHGKVVGDGQFILEGLSTWHVLAEDNAVLVFQG